MWTIWQRWSILLWRWACVTLGYKRLKLLQPACLCFSFLDILSCSLQLPVNTEHDGEILMLFVWLNNSSTQENLQENVLHSRMECEALILQHCCTSLTFETTEGYRCVSASEKWLVSGLAPLLCQLRRQGLAALIIILLLSKMLWLVCILKPITVIFGGTKPRMQRWCSCKTETHR